MTHDEFITQAIGKPWVNRADGPDSYDCWGIVVAYYREVLGKELSIYLDGDISDGYLKEIESERWTECSGGIVFMCFKDGAPSHCGLVFGDKVLHAAGWERRGQVTIQPLRKIKKLFKDVRVYDYC